MKYYVSEGGSVHSPLVSQLGSQHRFLFDALGSTLGLTNDAGSLSDTFLYEAFGTSLGRTGATQVTAMWAAQYGWYQDDADEATYLLNFVYRPSTATALSGLAASALSSGAVLPAPPRRPKIPWFPVDPHLFVLVIPLLRAFVLCIKRVYDEVMDLGSEIPDKRERWHKYPDNFRHCLTTCRLMTECGTPDSVTWYMGFVRENFQWVMHLATLPWVEKDPGKWWNQLEVYLRDYPKDIVANQAGIGYARQGKDCSCACRARYPSE